MADSDLSNSLKRLNHKSNTRLIISVLVISVLGWFGWPLLSPQLWGPISGRAAAPNQVDPTATAFTFEASSTPSPIPSETPVPTPDLESQMRENAQSQFLISISEEGIQHLFLFDSHTLELQRVSDGNAHDENPALSPDGQSIMYASNFGGQWDLREMNLAEGTSEAILHTAAYEGAPSWSGDGEWVAFERYKNDNLDIYMRPVDRSLDAVRLTSDSSVDHSPAWAPTQNLITFVSERSGQNQIWLLYLDRDGEERLQALGQSQSPIQAEPAWSPDGRYLAWSAFVDGFWRVYVQDMQAEDALPFEIGLGNQPSWSPNSNQIAAVAVGATENFLLAYDLNGQLVFPPYALPGTVRGMVWGAAFPDELPASIQAISDRPLADWGHSQENGDSKRLELESVANVSASHSMLIPSAKQSFEAMRGQLSQSLGWDPLSHLERLYLPLSVPPDPSLEEDWSYTGRSFNLLESLLWTEWAMIFPEQINGVQYWHIFLRPVDELAEWGRPLTISSELLALNNLEENPSTSGNWVDATSLFADFGWERQAAASNWQQYFPSAHLTQFVFAQEASWQTAMLQIYPESKLKEFLSQ